MRTGMVIFGVVLMALAICLLVAQPRSKNPNYVLPPWAKVSGWALLLMLMARFIHDGWPLAKGQLSVVAWYFVVPMAVALTILFFKPRAAGRIKG
jgi:hypothetical protein